MACRWLTLLVALPVFVGSISLPNGSFASESPISQTPPVSFINEVAPLLVDRCSSCHGDKNPEGDYQLTTFARLQKPGMSEAPTLVPGNPVESEIYRLIASDDDSERMPKDAEPLSADKRALIKRWIEQGAKFDGPDPNAPLASLVPKPPYPQPPAVYPRPVPVAALALNPDGTLLASGGYHEVLVWNAADGSLVRRIPNIAQRVHALAFSPDGTLLAVAAGTPGRVGELKLFRSESGELLSDLATTSDELFDVEFSRDRARLAACGADRTIRIYDVIERKELQRVEAHSDWVMAVAWSADGGRLASASRDKTARVINAASGEIETTYQGHDEQIFDVAFSDDGQWLFSAGRGREIHRWSAAGKDTSNKDVRTKETGRIIGRAESDILQLLVRGNATYAATADGKVLTFSEQPNEQPKPEMDKGQETKAKDDNAANAEEQKQESEKKDATRFVLTMTYEGPREPLFAIAVTPDGNRLATGSFGGRIHIYEKGIADAKRQFLAAPGLGSGH